MSGKHHWLGTIFVCTTFLIATPTMSFADCQADIDKVEEALGRSSDNGIDQTTADTMRQLLDQADEQQEKGDEAKCQELINQAKAMGNVE